MPRSPWGRKFTSLLASDAVSACAASSWSESVCAATSDAVPAWATDGSASCWAVADDAGLASARKRDISQISKHRASAAMAIRVSTTLMPQSYRKPM